MRSDITVLAALSGVRVLRQLNPVHNLQTYFKTHFPINTQQPFPYLFSHYSSVHTSSLTCTLHALIIIQFKNFALLRMSQSTLFLQALTLLAITSPYFISSSYCCTTEMEYTVNTPIFLGNF